MRFTVHERPGQMPVLLAEGLIDQHVVPRLQAAIATFRGQEIWLRSGGGYAGVDHEAGRLIRAAGLVTRIPAGWACRGACNFMFMGGIQRHIDDAGAFIVHMFTNEGDVSDLTMVARSSATLASQDYLFLMRMGVRPSLLSDVMYREAARDRSALGRCMSQAELLQYNVATAAFPRSRRGSQR